VVTVVAVAVLIVAVLVVPRLVPLHAPASALVVLVLPVPVIPFATCSATARTVGAGE
jgi:hypothetical protein